MSKYINADTLKTILNREHLDHTPMIEKKLVLQIIDNMPFNDTAEIVRCKDCKYRDSNTHIDFARRDLLLCNLRKEKVWATEFCSYGDTERRTEND